MGVTRLRTTSPEVVTLGETMVLFTPGQQAPLRYVDHFGKTIAGAETNVAIGLVRLGHTVAWISRVGDDEFGEYIRMRVRGEGVDTTHVSTDSRHQTGVMFKESYLPGQTHVHYYRKGSAASCLTSSDVPDELIRGARILHLTGITPALADTCHEAVLHAMSIAKKAGVLISFDPNIRLKLWNDRERMTSVLLDLLEKSDIALIGHEEAQILFGTDRIEPIADHLHEKGVHTVVIKRSEAGASASRQGHVEHAAAFVVQSVVDAVGAGDAFAAGFLSGVLRDLSLAESLRWGNTCGALATQVRGDIESLPTIAQVDALWGNGKQVER